jgi:hypothetical protein
MALNNELKLTIFIYFRPNIGTSITFFRKSLDVLGIYETRDLQRPIREGGRNTAINRGFLLVTS